MEKGKNINERVLNSKLEALVNFNKNKEIEKKTKKKKITKKTNKNTENNLETNETNNNSEENKKEKKPKTKKVANKSKESKENENKNEVIDPENPKPSKKNQKKKQKADQDNNTTTRKWKDDKDRQLDRGRFTPDEESKIIQAICEFGAKNNITYNDFVKLLTEKAKVGNEKTSSPFTNIWTTIAEVLPNRSVQSIHNYCHREFHPYNYKGAWTKEETEKLITLYNEYGAKWDKIAAILERTPTNVKDKFKNLGGENYKERVNEFTVENWVKLLKVIEKHLENVEIVNFDEIVFKKISTNIEKREIDEKVIITIDEDLRDDNRPVVIKNLLRQLINIDEIKKIIYNSIQIPWTSISSEIRNLSYDDCKNNWIKLLLIFDVQKEVEAKKDIKLLEKIIRYDFDDINEVKFDFIKNKRNTNENKKRLEDIMNDYNLYKVLSFKEIVEKALKDLKKFLEEEKEKNEKEKEEVFEKKLKKVDFKQIYNEFLNNKGI